MGENGENKRKLDDMEMAAVAVGVTVVVFFLVYWAAQIRTTYELLASAYGW